MRNGVLLAIVFCVITTCCGLTYKDSTTKFFVNKGALSISSAPSDYRVNLTTCYDATSGTSTTTNGATLTSLNDLGSMGNTLSITAGAPKYYTNIQNGLPAIYFDGSSALGGTNMADSALPITSFIVFRGTNWTTGAEQYICEMEVNCHSFIKIGTTVSLGTWGGSAVLIAGNATNNVTCMGTLLSNGASSFIQINNALAVTGNPGSTALSNYPAIGASSGASSKYTGYVMEWRVYNVQLTPAQITQVQTYLNYKWGIY